MHRFAVSFYKKPIAVNDLGYVSYKNSNYVLDLYGLSSIDALDHRRNDPNSEWMNNLAKSKNVEFVMIYPEWFKDIPDNWIKSRIVASKQRAHNPCRKYSCVLRLE